MSVAELKEFGNGTVDYRLEIVGLPYQFVSCERLAGVYATFDEDSVTRFNGLRMKGKSFGYSINALAGEIQGDSLSFEIVDLDERVTTLLASNPRRTTRLVQNLTDADYFNVYVSSVAGWETGTLAYVGQETVRIVTTVPASNQFVLNRGVLGSEAFSYYVEGEFRDRSAITFSDVPITLQGRKVKLYAYGENDDATGNGVLIWRGVLTSDLQLANGGIWTLQASSIISKLDQEIGGGGFGKEFNIRGIYHPAGSGFTLAFASGTLFGGTTLPTLEVKYEGFCETVPEFVSKFNEQLQFTASNVGFPYSVWLDQAPDGRLGFFFRTPVSFTNPASPNIVFVRTVNGIKEADPIVGPGGAVRPVVAEERLGEAATVSRTPYRVDLLDAGGAYGDFTPVSFTFTTDTVYAWLADAPMPEAIAAYQYVGTDWLTSDPPASRVYYNAPFVPSTVTELRATQEGRDGENLVRGLSGTNPVNSASRYIDTYCNGNYVLRNTDTTFTFAASLVTSGTVVDFFRRLTELSPTYGSQGLYPIITTDDIDLDGMSLTLSSTLLTPFVGKRNFTFFGEGKTLSEIFAEECKLLGCFPSITSDGKITMKKLRDFGKNEPGVFHVTSSNLITKNGFPRWSRSSDSIVNEAQLLTKYDPDEDEHLGDVFNALYTDSVTIFQKKKKYKITPFSQDTTVPDLSEVDLILWRLLGKWGIPRPEVSDIQLPITALSATIGDGAYLVIPQLPNVNTGQRGMEQVGLIQSVSYQLDEGKVNMSVVLSDPSLAGYCPSLQVVTASLKPATTSTYIVQVSASSYAPNTFTDISFFRASDKVEVYDTKDWNPVLRTTGTISGTPYENAGSYFVDIEFPSALSTQNASYLAYSGTHVALPAFSSSGLTLYQQQFAFISSGTNASYFGV